MPPADVPSALLALGLPRAESQDRAATASCSDTQAVLLAEWAVDGPAQVEIINIMSGVLEGLAACPCFYL